MSELPFAPFVPAVNTPRVICRGASGLTYEFLVYPIGAHFFPNPGVYIVCKLAANGNYDAIDLRGHQPKGSFQALTASQGCSPRSHTDIASFCLGT